MQLCGVAYRQTRKIKKRQTCSHAQSEKETKKGVTGCSAWRENRIVWHTVSGAGRMCRRDSNQRQDEGQVICQAGYDVGQAGRTKGVFRRARWPEQVGLHVALQHVSSRNRGNFKQERSFISSVFISLCIEQICSDLSDMAIQ